MRILCIILSLLSCLLTDFCFSSAMANQKNIGEWTHYFAHEKLTHVVPTSSGKVFALSSGRMFSYNASDETVEEYNTITGLSDYNDIIDIAYNRTTQRLLIVYSNGNLDILSIKDNGIVNVPGIIRESTTNNKEVMAVTCNGKYAYLAMDYGVVVINMDKQEVADTYRLDIDGRAISGVTISGNRIYVLGSKNIASYGSDVISATFTDNLLDKTKWSAVTDATTLADIKAKAKDERQQRNIYVVNSSGVKYASMIEDTYNKCYWGSDDNNQLSRYGKDDGGTMTLIGGPYRPYGPASNNFYNLRFAYNTLYGAGMGIQTNTPSTSGGMVQTLNSEDRWNKFETPSMEQIGHTYLKTNNITIDPRDTAHVMVGGNEGLYEFISGKFIKHYDKDNSPILALEDGNSKTYQLILGLLYDNSGKLWVLNTYCSRGILQLNQKSPRDTITASCVWETFAPHPEIDRFKPYEKYLAHPFFDSKGRMWFINGHYYESEYYCYDTSADKLTVFTADKNQDGIQLYNNSGDGWIRHITEDREGNIWTAGTHGVCYLPAEETERASNAVQQTKISRNDGSGLADYLLKTVDATCIIFDSANRMYVSTMGNGVYVISPDRNTEEQHFTTENSFLMSDNCRFLALNEENGELYVSTDKGLCSVTTGSIKVAESLDKNNVLVYPNPVAPNYSGPITIKNLTFGADIKITTASGAVVHTGRSDAGIYQWDGCDQNGDRVASGVYNILLSTADGDSGCVAKVAIIK